MYKVMTGIAALTLLGATAFPLPAGAADPQIGAVPHAAKSAQASAQTTELSAQRRHYYRRHYGYWGPRRYWGPRYGYYGYPYGYPYGYYRPYYPGVAVGIGPFGFGFF